jgi:hypothetical protein
MTASPIQSAPQPLDLLTEQTRLQHDMRLSLQALQKASEIEQEVVLTDIDIPFSRMVTFMVKWALASIPATLIVGLILGGCFLLFSLVITSLGLGLGSLR